jgi:hypothetical protein
MKTPMEKSLHKEQESHGLGTNYMPLYQLFRSLATHKLENCKIQL